MRTRILRQASALLALALLSHCKPQSTGEPPAPSATAQTTVDAAAAAPALPSAVARPSHSGKPKVVPPSTAAITVAGDPAPTDGAAPKESATSVGLPTVDFGPAGALVLRGYPEPLSLGMIDYATYVGYAKDSSEVVSCGNMAAGFESTPKGAELGDTCFFRTRTGKTEKVGLTETGPGVGVVGPKLGEKLGFLRDGTSHRLRSGSGMDLNVPSVKTTWPYSKDVAIVLSKALRPDGGSVLRIGGSVTGQEPVFPVTLAIASSSKDGPPYGGAWNAILVSPDNTELAFIGHFACMEWCNDELIERLTYGRIAGLVFNDTGFRAHQKKDFAASRDLFLKATWADPRAALPPYNLACAYALLKDEANAAKALKLAISVGGDKVKARAKKDADFKGVLTAAWFRDLTG